MTITISPHISLQPLLQQDAQVILELVNDSRAQLEKYLYWVDEVIDLNCAQRYILQRIDSGLAHSQWFNVMFNGKVSGVFAIKSVDQQGVAELGYWLSHRVHGHGIISQIVAALPQLPVHSPIKIIEFRCLERNIASISVAKKSGAKHIASLADFAESDGVNQALLVYQAQLKPPSPDPA